MTVHSSRLAPGVAPEVSLLEPGVAPGDALDAVGPQATMEKRPALTAP
jgi:hypothetical protein